MSGKPRPCGCKGFRTCLICEKEFNLSPFDEESLSAEALEKNGIPCYVYCPICNLAFPGYDCFPLKHPDHTGEPIEFPGIYVQSDFFSEDETLQLMKDCDSLPWDSSVSGRRKQNFGPKANFKKQKLQLGDFKGVPKFSRLFHERIAADVPLLKDYYTIEQCSLEYDPERGASIEPHIDDCWVWGERIVTLNLAGDSVLTMTKYHGNSSKYNLKDVDMTGLPENVPDVCVRIPQPARSLVVIYGSARYQWLHSVLRRDIKERRVCIALREFTKRYLDPEEPKGQLILQAAANYFDT